MEEIVDRAARALSHVAALGIIEEVTRSDVAAFAGGLGDSFLEDLDADYAVRLLVFRFLEDRDVALAYDSELTADYEASCRDLVDSYAAIADGHLDDVDVEIMGSRFEKQDATIVVEWDGERFTGTMEYRTHWTDAESLHDLLNRVLESTGTDRRFVGVVPAYPGQMKYVVFAEPEAVEPLDEYIGGDPERRDAWESEPATGI